MSIMSLENHPNRCLLSALCSYKLPLTCANSSVVTPCVCEYATRMHTLRTRYIAWRVCRAIRMTPSSYSKTVSCVYSRHTLGVVIAATCCILSFAGILSFDVRGIWFMQFEILVTYRLRNEAQPLELEVKDVINTLLVQDCPYSSGGRWYGGMMVS
jgi:hypothetical protein